MHSGSFGRLLPRSLLGQNEIASLLFYIPSLYHSSIEKHTHARAPQLSESMPAITCVFSLRDGSLFFSVSHSWILIVCLLFSRHSCAAKNSSSLSSSFLPSFERRRRRKRKSDDDISIRVIVSRWLRYPLCACVVRPSSIGRLGGNFPFCRNSEPLRISSLSTIKTTGPENKVNSSSPPPSSPPPPRFFPQLVLKRTTTTTTTTTTTSTSRANVLQDYPSTAIRR